MYSGTWEPYYSEIITMPVFKPIICRPQKTILILINILDSPSLLKEKVID